MMPQDTALTTGMKISYAIYRALWLLFLPLVFVYLLLRSRAEPEYRFFLKERFGLGKPAEDARHIWIHAVSLGEVRSAQPIIDHYLSKGEAIVVSVFTPAGRHEVTRLWGDDVTVVWVPFEFRACYRRFLRRFEVKFGLVMEVEFWPAMILSCRSFGVPLFLCNGQYPDKSFAKDRNLRAFRRQVVAKFRGALVKTSKQAERFRALGLGLVAVAGEMRFEQPVPSAQLEAAKALIPSFGARNILTLGSLVEKEEEIVLPPLIRSLKAKSLGRTLLILVPRSKDRFDAISRRLAREGLKVIRRSDLFDEDLRPKAAIDWEEIDVFLGDSHGEMFFYLALADQVLIGGGFTPAGSHNIIEALILKKSVAVGPEVWTIQFPFDEALAANVCSALDPVDLEQHFKDGWRHDPEKIDAFLNDHGGAVQKSDKALREWLNDATFAKIED